jgi:hypothetical protein
MIKEDIKLSIRRVFTDRTFLIIAMMLIAAGLVYVTVTGLTLQGRDVQVYSRYTSFGEAHFYKSPWQHLVSFVVFGIAVVVTHLGLMVKFHNLERRGAAMIVGYAGIAVLFVAFMYSLFIMHLALR